MESLLISQYQSSWMFTAAVSMAVLFMLAFCGFALLQLLPVLRISRSPYGLFCESLLIGFLMFSIAGFAGIFLRLPLDRMFIDLSFGSALLLFLRIGGRLLEKH